MDPLIGGAAISAAGSVGANFIQNSGSKRSQKRANKYNVDFWNMQNEYNDPQAQMSRLKRAGLNPNLIYGTSPSSAVGTAGQIAPSKAEQYNFDNPLKDINSYVNLRNTEQQTDNLKAQNTVLVQESALKAAQTANIGINTAKSKFDLNLAEDLRNTSLQAAEASVKQMQTNTFGIELDNLVKNQTVKDKVTQIKYAVEQAKATLEGTKLDNKMKSFETQLNIFGITKQDSKLWRMIFGETGQKMVDDAKNWWNNLDNPSKY